MSGVVAYLNQLKERQGVDEPDGLPHQDRSPFALDDQMLVPECKEMRAAVAELSRLVDQRSRK